MNTVLMALREENTTCVSPAKTLANHIFSILHFPADKTILRVLYQIKPLLKTFPPLPVPQCGAVNPKYFLFFVFFLTISVFDLLKKEHQV